MELTELRSRIKSGTLAGAYLFVGEEEYLSRYYMKELSRAAAPDDAMAVLNHTVFDGPEVERAAVLEAIESPPMMSEYKLVEWKYAEIGQGRAKISEKLLSELADAARGTGFTVFAVLIAKDGIELGSQKKPSRAFAELSRHFDTLRFDKSTNTQLMSWLKRHFDAKGIALSRTAAERLISRVGRSMDTLHGEVEKLAALIHTRGGDEVTAADIDSVTSASSETDTFALNNALTERNKPLAYAALLDLKTRRGDPSIVIKSLADFYNEILTVSAFIEDGMDKDEIERVMKIHPYKLTMCIAASKRYKTEEVTRAAERLAKIDTASKAGGSRGYSPLEMFIAEFV